MLVFMLVQGVIFSSAVFASKDGNFALSFRFICKNTLSRIRSIPSSVHISNKQTNKSSTLHYLQFLFIQKPWNEYGNWCTQRASARAQTKGWPFLHSLSCDKIVINNFLDFHLYAVTTYLGRDFGQVTK